MQKLILITIIAAVLALMPFTSAANAYVLEEFTKENPAQAIVLEAGDIVDFSLLGGTHRLMLKEISRTETSIKLNVYPFSNEASMAQQVPFFGIDNVVKIDLDKDDNDDILLDIHEIKGGEVTLLVVSAELMAEAQEENAALQETPEITGTPQGQGVVNEQKDYSKTFWAIGIAIVALAAILYVKALNAKKEKHKGKKEKAEE